MLAWPPHAPHATVAGGAAVTRVLALLGARLREEGVRDQCRLRCLLLQVGRPAAARAQRSYATFAQALEQLLRCSANLSLASLSALVPLVQVRGRVRAPRMWPLSSRHGRMRASGRGAL